VIVIEESRSASIGDWAGAPGTKNVRRLNERDRIGRRQLSEVSDDVGVPAIIFSAA
jgi:hypothetical protein